MKPYYTDKREAERDALQAQVATLTAEVQMHRANSERDLAAWEEEHATVERVTRERDKAWGELGFTKNDLGNAVHRAEAAEARVLTAERERDEARAKSAIDEAGYDSILTTAQALQARVTALAAAAAMAITAKKPARR